LVSSKERINVTTAGTPIKVDIQTDKLISHAAHFLGRSKKDVVDIAIREYIENHREAIQNGVSEALQQLDGTVASSVALLAGLTREELDGVGGVSEPTKHADQ
jgi:hypothetical protein